MFTINDLDRYGYPVKNVVAAISLGHRGDTAFPLKSPCSLVSLFPFGKFFFR
jgi:hypothetical protein